ncbi:MAG TPA: ribonuclease R [Polyangiales bacterium]|nr:ribonuclease R [Polyangiales bacterium]
MNKKDTKQPESLEHKLLGLLRAHARSMHVGELRKLMMMGKKEHGELANQLGLMAEAGLVTELPGGKYRAPKQPGRARDAAADGGSARTARVAPSKRAVPAEERPARDEGASSDEPAADSGEAGSGGELKTRRRAERVARRRVSELQSRSAEPGGGLATRRTRDSDRRTQATAPRRASPAHRGSEAPYRTPRARSELTGRLNVNTRGFGFVTPDEPGPDIFIPPPALGSALHGDKVRVRVFPSPKGFDGQVLEVIERATHYIGGQLLMLPYATFIEPDDERLKARVQVVGKMPENVRTGQGVIAKVVGFPDHPGEPLLASIVEAFEAAEFAEFEIRRILLSQAVREDFDEDVQAEARAYGDHVTEADCEGRVDYRDLDLLTIDPDDARDHDDAVYAEPASGGGYRVIVAIADVSHYVKPDTALDREALARGCTIYLPSRAIPMLPRELSSHLASLVPHEDRLALAVDLELDSQGNVRKHKFVECVMRSAARLSYGGVARALGMTEETELQPAAESRKPQLELLLEVAKLLGVQRKSRGSLDFDLPEAKVKLNPETGEPVSIERSRTDPGVRSAYNLIEEMMLLANEVVARDLSKRKVAAIYRVHGAPNEEKVMAFAELAGSFGFKIDDDIAEQPGKLAKFLATVADTPHAEVLSYLLLRAMQQATYATDNIGHFGLAAEDYVHFTSPIRRYPDLAIHRIVRKIARGEPLHGKKLKTELAEQAAESSRLERRAMLIEREVVDLYRAMLMRDRVGEEFEATITGITEHGIFAAIESPCVDVFCRLQSLPPDHYESDQYGTRLVGLASGRSFALFDRIAVRIEDVSVARRRISAVPVEVLASPAVEQHGAGRQRRKSTTPPKRGGGGPQVQTSHKGRPRNERDQRRRTKEDTRKQKGKSKGKRR